jgi:hypothetical protein
MPISENDQMNARVKVNSQQDNQVIADPSGLRISRSAPSTNGSRPSLSVIPASNYDLYCELISHVSARALAALGADTMLLTESGGVKIGERES